MPSLELRSEAASPGQARAFVRRVMAEWGIDADVADDAELLVTELVTNAVIHARTAIEVEILRHDGQVEFSVADRSSRQIQLRIPTADAVTGRGVFLLDQISPDWEVIPTSGGKMVRFRLASEAGVGL